MRGLEAACPYFEGVPTELLFDQMKPVIIEDRRSRGTLQDARYGFRSCPALMVPLPPRRGPQSVRLPMARSVRSSAAMDTPRSFRY